MCYQPEPWIQAPALGACTGELQRVGRQCVPMMTRLYKKVTLCGVLYIHTKQVSSGHQRRVMITSFHPSTTAAWQLAILEDSSTAMSTRVAFVECANTYLLQGMSAGSGAARTVAMTVVITMRTALSCILNATMFSRVGVSISRKRSHIKDALTSFCAGEGGERRCWGSVAGSCAFYVPAVRF